MGTITFGLCVKNSQETVKSALDSLLSQDFPDEFMEIIVVDGCSSDLTLEIVNTCLSGAAVRSTVVSDQGRGLGAARQIVLDQASGKYIIYVGGDAVFPVDYARVQIDFMERNVQVAASNPRIEYQPQKSIVANVQNLLFSVSPNDSNGTIFRTCALKSIRGFDIRIKGASEDRDLMFRLKMAGFQYSENPDAKLYHGREETLKDVFIRYLWYGFGDHFISHKHRFVTDIPYNLPPLYVAHGLKLSLRAYSKHKTKKAFLIPLLCIIASVSWCIGFLRAHRKGYGHLVYDSNTGIR